VKAQPAVRCDDEVIVRLTGREVEAVSLGLRTVLITTPHDGTLCDAAATGLSKLPGALRSDRRTCAARGEHDMNKRLTLSVIGLSLGGCGALALERQMRRLSGILEVYVNPATENAYVDYDPERVTSAAIAAKVRELGYETKVSTR
jgi:copper chaperone CopZ